MSQAKRPVWEQLDDESAPAYSAFKHYRDKGDKRSYVNTAEELRKSRQLIERWAFQYRWQDRVRGHTRAQEAETTRHRARRHRKMYDAQAGVAAMLIQKAVKCLENIEPSALTVTEALRFIKLGVDIEREARAFNIHERVGAPESAAQATVDRIAELKD